MRFRIAASAVSLAALACAPALFGQDTTTTSTTTATVGSDGSMTADQRSTYEQWPAEQRTRFDAWPVTYRTYFWTLSPSQQEGWWRLTDEQRAQIYAMTPDARVAAWASIEQQLAAVAQRATPATPAPGEGEAATPATPSPRASDTTASTPSRVGDTPSRAGNMTPPPPEAMNKTYPICSRKITDSCQNPGEGGAKGRSRALKYWPGKPASEIAGPKPQG